MNLLSFVSSVLLVRLCRSQSNPPQWEFELSAQGGSAVLGGNGLIYIGSTSSTDSNFYAVDATTGQLVWSYLCAMNTGEVRAALIGSNGLVYAPTDTRGIYAFNALNGSLMWNYDLPSGSITGVTIDKVSNVLYVVGDSYIAAVNGTSTAEIWKFQSDDKTGYAAPVLGNNGILYSQFNGTVEGRRTVDGWRIWGVRYDYVSHSQHAVGADNAVYISVEEIDDEYYLQRLNGDTGLMEWHVAILDSYSAAVDDILGVVYVNERGCCGHLTSVRQSDGQIMWTFEFATSNNENMQTLPLVSSDGMIYFGSNERHIYAVNSDGMVVWKSDTVDFMSSSYQVQLDIDASMVYVGGTDNFLRSYDILNFTIAPTPAPTDTDCSSSCPTKCPNGHKPGTVWEKNGCLVYCMEQPVNGQCLLDGSGCTSGCYDDGDDDSVVLGTVVIVSVACAVFAIGIVVALVWFFKCRTPSSTSASTTHSDTKSPFV